VFIQNRRLWVRLRATGGTPHAMPCHHNLETYLTAYIEGPGLAEDSKGPLFRTLVQLQSRPNQQACRVLGEERFKTPSTHQRESACQIMAMTKSN
jgi:hypothetical protein